MIDHIGMPVSDLARATEFYLKALSPLGIRHLDMPLTPNKIWEAIRSAG